jgi:hypothetical protein
MAAHPIPRKLLRIHKDDNVLIVVTPVQPGDEDIVDDREITFTQRIAVSAKEDIPAGTHIHLHNLKSDYIDTYTLDKDHVYVK